jgi:hypothetical protein
MPISTIKVSMLRWNQEQVEAITDERRGKSELEGNNEQTPRRMEKVRNISLTYSHPVESEVAPEASL